MKKEVFTAILVATSLTACGNKNDANEKNFSAALNEYFAKKGDLCLGAHKWPIDVTEMEQRVGKAIPGSDASQMTALEAVGLATHHWSNLHGRVNGLGFRGGHGLNHAGPSLGK